MKVAIGTDHGGWILKRVVLKLLEERGVEVVDFGTDGDEEAVDYPDYAMKVAEAVSTGRVDRGILICGTGIGMSIVANKFCGVRAAVAHDVYSARMSRLHNDANVLAVGGRVLGPGVAREVVAAWLDTPFEGGRHGRRLEKIRELERRMANAGNAKVC